MRPEEAEMIHRGLTLLAVALLPAVAVASQEQILPPREIKLTVDVGQPFGTVVVTMEARGGCFQQTITKMSIEVDGKKLVVPAKALSDLRNVRPGSLQLRRERGWGKHPWLYVTFQLDPKPGQTKEAERPRVYLAIQQGKLVHRAINTPLPGGRHRYEQKKL